MQGLSLEHLEGSQPLPTSTPEGSPRQSEVTIVTTPQVEHTDSLEHFRITNTREEFRLHRDSERPFMRLNSFGDLVVTSSGSPVGPFPGIEGQDLFWSTGVFRRDLFGPGSPMISEINPPVISEISSPETVPFTTAYHFTVPAEMAHLTDTTSVPTGFTAVSLAPINTPRTPNVTLTLPPGYHALNASIPTPTQTPSSSPGGPSSSGHSLPGFIPTLPQFPFGGPSSSSTGSLNPSGAIPSFTPTYQILVGGQFHQGGMTQPPLSGKIPFGTQIPIGTQPPIGTPPSIGGPTPPYGKNIPPSLAQYWNQLIQHPPQSTGGQQFPAASVIPPSMGQPYPGSFNPIWGANAQTQVPVPGYNPMSYYPLQPPPNLPGSSHYMQTAYGPTGLPTGLPPQSHQYPQVNRQLPFIATLDLPDLSRILNDPIRHSPQWPAIPAKLPSDIPKFDGKAGEDPNNHVMTFHLWCSSNSLMDDSIHLRLFQRTLTGSAAKWYIELP
jgi:hypothetical protein